MVACAKACLVRKAKGSRGGLGRLGCACGEQSATFWVVGIEDDGVSLCGEVAEQLVQFGEALVVEADVGDDGNSGLVKSNRGIAFVDFADVTGDWLIR